jgi:hypothetical protein
LGVSDRNAYVLIDGNATAGAISDKLEQMLANIKADDTVFISIILGMVFLTLSLLNPIFYPVIKWLILLSEKSNSN